MSSLLGEWNRFIKGDIGMSSERAMIIAGHALAIAGAAEQGRKLPLDWKRQHPSLARQMQKHFDQINAHSIIRNANILPDIFIEYN